MDTIKLGPRRTLSPALKERANERIAQALDPDAWVGFNRDPRLNRSTWEMNERRSSSLIAANRLSTAYPLVALVVLRDPGLVTPEALPSAGATVDAKQAAPPPQRRSRRANP